MAVLAMIKRGQKKRRTHRGSLDFGEVPDIIELDWEATETLRIGKEVILHLDPILDPQVLDASGKLVHRVELEWCSDNRYVGEIR